MIGFEGSLARQLKFGDTTTTTAPAVRQLKPRLMLAAHPAVGGPGKYRVLEHRRRQAQMQARRALGLF